MDDDPKYDKTLDKIRELFSDESVDIEVCRERLHGLKDEIDCMLESLPSE